MCIEGTHMDEETDTKIEDALLRGEAVYLRLRSGMLVALEAKMEHQQKEELLSAVKTVLNLAQIL